MPTVSGPVVQIAASTTLDDTLANGATLVCLQPVTLTPAFVSLASGFACTVVNLSGGDVTFAPGVTPSSSPLTIPTRQSASLRAFTYMDGSVLAAQDAVPGQVIGVTTGVTGPSSVVLSWQAPASGDAVSVYIVNYRSTSAAGAWTSQYAAGNNLTVSGLTAATQYDFEVIATNSVGDGLASSIVTATTASAASTSDYLLTTGFLPTAGSTWASTAAGIGVNAADNSAVVDGSYTVPASVAFAWSLSDTVAPTTGLVPGSQFSIDVHNYWSAYLNGPGAPGACYLWAIAKDSGGNVVQSLCWTSAFTFT